MPNSLGISDQEYAQLGFYAALTGQTPEQYVTTRAEQLPVSQQTQAPTNWSNANPMAPTSNGWLNISEQQIRDNAAANQGLINNLGGWNNNVTGANAASLNQIGSLIGQQGTADQTFVNQSQGLTNQLGGYATSANNFDWNALSGYQSGLSNLNASNQGYLTNLGGQYQALSPQLTSSLAPNYLTSQAAGAYADPNSIAAQNNALGFLGGAMNGSLNYSSQAAQAYADPEAVAQQYQALSDLQRASQGSLNGTSQAATARASLEALDQQQAAADRLTDIGNGSLDYQSQAAGAYASAYDIANQTGSANQLQDIANGMGGVNFNDLPGIHDLYNASVGGLNVNINQLQGANRLYGVGSGTLDVYAPDIAGYTQLSQAANGGQDVHVGQEDPGAYAAQQEALAKYQGLTDPTVTSAEEYIYKQAQLQQEQDERANRAATLTNLRQRGLSGAGAEIGQAALASQQTSQNRLLADLGAQAQAVNRSMTALQGYGALSSTMSDQANQIALQNAQNRLNALGQFTDIGVNVATGNADRRNDAISQYASLESALGTNNANRQLQAEGMYTGLGADTAQFNSNLQYQATVAANNAYAQLRAQGFDEEYARRQAQDVASQFNANMEFQGSQAAYGARSDIRNQEFDESYKRGTAADVMTTNNLNRQLSATGMYSDAARGARQDSFGENYARGQAADTASANNQQTQLSAGVNYGNLASTQRTQSFNEAFSRGTAADQTAQFNENNRVDITKYNQNYAQQERDSAWNRATGYTALGLQGNAQIGQNLTSGFNAGQQVNADTFARNQSVLGMQDLTNTRQNTASTKQTDRNILLQNQVMNNNNDYWNRLGTTTNLGIANNGQLTGGIVGLNGQRAGGAAAQTASEYAMAIANQGANDDIISQFLGGTGQFNNKKS